MTITVNQNDVQTNDADPTGHDSGLRSSQNRDVSESLPEGGRQWLAERFAQVEQDVAKVHRHIPESDNPMSEYNKHGSEKGSTVYEVNNEPGYLAAKTTQMLVAALDEKDTALNEKNVELANAQKLAEKRREEIESLKQTIDLQRAELDLERRLREIGPSLEKQDDKNDSLHHTNQLQRSELDVEKKLREIGSTPDSIIDSHLIQRLVHVRPSLETQKEENGNLQHTNLLQRAIENTEKILLRNPHPGPEHKALIERFARTRHMLETQEVEDEDLQKAMDLQRVEQDLEQRLWEIDSRSNQPMDSRSARRLEREHRALKRQQEKKATRDPRRRQRKPRQAFRPKDPNNNRKPKGPDDDRDAPPQAPMLPVPIAN